MENNIIEAYINDWYDLLDNNKKSKSLMILPNRKIIQLADLKGNFNYLRAKGDISTDCGEHRLIVRSCSGVENDKASRLAGFSFERIYIIDDGILSDETLAILRFRLRSPLGIDCKMYINGKG